MTTTIGAFGTSQPSAPLENGGAGKPCEDQSPRENPNTAASSNRDRDEEAESSAVLDRLFNTFCDRWERPVVIAKSRWKKKRRIVDLTAKVWFEGTTLKAVLKDAESYYRNVPWEYDLEHFDLDKAAKAEVLEEYEEYAVARVLDHIRKGWDDPETTDDDPISNCERYTAPA